MKALQDHKAAALLKTTQENIAECSILFSYKSTNYSQLEKWVEGHITYKSDKETTSKKPKMGTYCYCKCSQDI